MWHVTCHVACKFFCLHRFNAWFLKCEVSLYSVEFGLIYYIVTYPVIFCYLLCVMSNEACHNCFIYIDLLLGIIVSFNFVGFELMFKFDIFCYIWLHVTWHMSCSISKMFSLHMIIAYYLNSKVLTNSLEFQ